MKRNIPLEVSSTLCRIATDKPLEISPYANATGVTTEKAPVLIAVRSAATVTAEEFATRMVKAGGQGTEAQARLALNAVAAVLGELVEEYGAITVNTPFGTVQTFIAGTLENAQDAPDPETNRAFLGVVVPEVYRRRFAQMTAYVPTGACPASLKRVRDKATSAKGIRGTDPFYLEGRGMTFGGEGETLELLDAATRDKVCDIAVDDESKSPVQFQCALSPQGAVEAGDYLVRLTTLAGGEATLWPVELKVELLEAGEAPTGPRITGVGGDTRVSKSAGSLTVSGVNLAERREDWGVGETRLELNIKKSPDDDWNTLSPSAEFGIVDPCDAHTVTLKASELYSSAFTIDDPVPGQEYPLKLVAYVNGVKANEFEFTGIGA